ncbi:MAG TPA: hypothetical protein VGY55_10020 [Pirellulales bacterium]|jgi:hypothetical protein|nr:hypothetical protein [Pirellulales bacterium]
MIDDPRGIPPAGGPAQPAKVAPGNTSGDAISPETLKAALKAFKKRLKLTRLDDASRIGRGPMSSGQGSSIAGITPPNQYPRAVWEELVNQGKLKHAGHGMYSL